MLESAGGTGGTRLPVECAGETLVFLQENKIIINQHVPAPSNRSALEAFGGFNMAGSNLLEDAGACHV